MENLIKFEAEKTATVSIRGEKSKRCKIHNNEGVEFIYPYGTYSMCPVLSADKPKMAVA